MTDKEAPQVTLSEFIQVSSTLIHHIMKALSTKSCPLNPIPTQLLKDHLDLIVRIDLNIPLYDHFKKKQISIWRT